LSPGTIAGICGAIRSCKDLLRETEIKVLQQGKRVLGVLRLQPFDTTTEAGRSRERFRRAAMTTMSSGMSRAVGILAGLITVPLTFRYLGPERYGLWMVMVSMIGAMGFADLGIGNGLVNTISEAHGKDDHSLAREYISSAFVMLSAIAALLAIAAVIAYPFLPWMRLFNVKSAAVAAEGSRAIIVLYAWFVISIPLGVVGHVQWGLQRGFVSQAVSTVGGLAGLAMILVVVALHGSLVWLVFGSTVGSISSMSANSWVLFRSDPWLLPSFRAFRFSAAKKILNLGLLFFVLQCAVVVSYTSDNIVIAQVMGAAAVAAYAVPQKLFNPVSQVFGMAVAPLWPAYGEAIARGDVAWVKRTFRGALKLALGITIPSCTLLALAGPWILRVFFGKALHAPMSLLIVLAVWGVVSAVSATCSIFLNAAGALRIQAIFAVICSSLNLGISIVLTRKYGVIGVCLGSIITQVLIAHPLFVVLIRKLFRDLGRAKALSAVEPVADPAPAIPI
jgi:O-antigen/teichoic acid export membrane protein